MVAEACSLLDEGVTGIIDGTTGSREATVMQLCQTHKVPCFTTKSSRHFDRHSEEIDDQNTNAVFNMLPEKEMIADVSCVIYIYIHYYKYRKSNYDLPRNMSLN